MKISSMFHVSALLMAVLVFSTPFVSFAQQNAEVPASKATTAPDTLPDETLVAIVRKAKADAERDVNEVIWFAGGFLGGAVGGGVIFYSILGYSLVSSIGGEASNTDPMPFLCCVGGLGLALGSLPIVFGKLNTPSPPPGRLLGKSPEYVKAYVYAYVKTARHRRDISMTAGYAIPVLLTIISIATRE